MTHHNQLKQDMYLRISFELYLKRLLVGMLDRVYEIGRDFRNEGVSFKHNPEFTQLEFYMAYADYLQVMDLTEQMVASRLRQVRGTPPDHLQGPARSTSRRPGNASTLRDGMIEPRRHRHRRAPHAPRAWQSRSPGRGRNPDPQPRAAS